MYLNFTDRQLADVNTQCSELEEHMQVMLGHTDVSELIDGSDVDALGMALAIVDIVLSARTEG